MLQGIAPGSVYNAIPNLSNMSGALALTSLLLERALLTIKTVRPLGSKSCLLGFLKVSQILDASVPLLPLFSKNMTYVPALAATLSVGYTHTVEANPLNSRYHTIARAIGHSLNIMAKTINSFAIGKMVHIAFYKGEKPGVLMAATTALVFGLSASNFISDWNVNAKLARLPRRFLWDKIYSFPPGVILKKPS